MTVYALGPHRPDISERAYVHPDATVIGRVTIGPLSSVWPGAVLRGDSGVIVIGTGTNIQDGAVIHATADLPTRIGDYCVIGHLAHLEGCTVEDGALIGSNAVVLHEAVVGAGSLVGASALVPNRMAVPPGTTALGVPVRIRDIAVVPGSIRASADLYVDLAARYRDDLQAL